MSSANSKAASDRILRDRVMLPEYTPLCPVHAVAMKVTGSPELCCYFRCPVKGCGRKKTVAKVEFVPRRRSGQ